MEKLLNEKTKFEKINLKNNKILSFALNQKKGVEILFKKLVASSSIPEETRRHLKPVVTDPGIIYGLCKVYKGLVHNLPSFRPILSATNTPTYELEKCLVPILKSLLVTSMHQRTHLPLLRKLLKKILNCYRKPRC